MATGIPTDEQVNAMSAVEYKVYENRVRREAQRQNLRLAKSRRRDPRARDYNTYMLLDNATNTVVSGNHENGLGLIEAHEFLQHSGVSR